MIKLPPKPKSLDEIFDNDPFGLLNDVKPQKASLSRDDKLQRSANEIENFIRDKHRLPADDSSDFAEKILARRYKALSGKDAAAAQALQLLCLTLQQTDDAQQKAYKNEPAALTEHAPCSGSNEAAADTETDDAADAAESQQHAEYKTLDEIFNEADELGLFAGLDALENLEPERPEIKQRRKARFISKTEPCRNFFNYEPLFDEASELLKQHVLRPVKFKGYEFDLQPGQFFFLNGLMVLVADCDRQNIIRENNKASFRLKLVFANETQSSPLNYSFLEALNIDDNAYFIAPFNQQGQVFLDKAAAKALEINRAASVHGEEISGYLYVLISLSSNSVIRNFMQHSELVKIGFCTTSVEERIKNAEHDPTYLYAPVQIVRAYSCHGIDPHQFERIVHALLWSHRLNIELTDEAGHAYQPREWFTISAKTACDIIERILNHTIDQYRIDPIQGKLKRK